MVIVGDKTATLPAVATPTEIVTLDHTFSAHPQPPESSGSPLPTLAIVGDQTVTLPPVPVASVLTTLGTSFALQPPPQSTPESSQTGPNTQSPVIVLDGGSTFTLPPIVQVTTLTTADRTLTLSPGGPPTITVEEPQTGPSSSTSQVLQVIVIGGSSITIGSVTKETTLTTDGQTVTLSPDMPPIVTANPLPTTPPTTTTDKDIGPLVTFSTWPAGAIITPVAVEVDKPKKSDDDEESYVIPCKLWFFAVSRSPSCLNHQG